MLLLQSQLYTLLYTLHHTLHHTYTPPTPRVNWPVRGENIATRRKPLSSSFDERRPARDRSLPGSESIGHFQNDAN